MDFLNYNSVVIDNVAMPPSIETLPGYEAGAAVTVNSASVLREDVDTVPTIVDDTLSYVPWGGDNLLLIDRMGDNQMPFDLLALVEKDETPATCQCFNAEVCYGSGLQYCSSDLTQKRSEIVRQVKAQVVGYLRSGSFNSRRLADIVNYFRLNAESFEEWHQSVIARLRLF